MESVPGQVDMNVSVNPASGPFQSFYLILLMSDTLDVVIQEPTKSTEERKFQGIVGLEELAKTDRILVQQVGPILNHCFPLKHFF